MKYGGNILGLVQQQKAGNAQRVIAGYGGGFDEVEPASKQHKLTSEELEQLAKQGRAFTAERQEAYDSFKLNFKDASEIESKRMDDVAEQSAKKCIEYATRYGDNKPRAYGAIESADLRFAIDKDDFSRVNFRKLESKRGSAPETIAEVIDGDVNARSIETKESGYVKQPGEERYNLIHRETGESNKLGNYEAIIVGNKNYNEQKSIILDDNGRANIFDSNNFLALHPEYRKLEMGELPDLKWDSGLETAFIRTHIDSSRDEESNCFEEIDVKTHPEYQFSAMDEYYVNALVFDENKDDEYFATIEKAALLTHKTQELIDKKLAEAKALNTQSNWDNLSSIPFAGDRSA